jgi:hypothetical protein
MTNHEIAQALETLACSGLHADAIQLDSARVCYIDGMRCADKDMHDAAARWFLKSIIYSCGMFGPTYKRAKEIMTPLRRDGEIVA